MSMRPPVRWRRAVSRLKAKTTAAALCTLLTETFFRVITPEGVQSDVNSLPKLWKYIKDNNGNYAPAKLRCSGRSKCRLLLAVFLSLFGTEVAAACSVHPLFLGSMLHGCCWHCSWDVCDSFPSQVALCAARTLAQRWHLAAAQYGH